MSVYSTKYDLSYWKLTLPVDSTGGINGTAVEVKSLENYDNPKYFTRGSDGAMVFTAMPEGATTSGSKYPRSELREMKGSERAAWNLKEGGTMTATLKIDQAPEKNDGTPGKMVVGQIHGKDEELVRLYWDAGKVYFVNDRAAGTGKETIFNLYDAQGKTPDVSLHEKFSYRIEAYGKELLVEVYADGKTYSSKTAINDVWQTDQFYFKAGVYLGVNETSAKGIGQVSFYALDLAHVKGEGLDGLILDNVTPPPPVVDPPKPQEPPKPPKPQDPPPPAPKPQTPPAGDTKPTFEGTDKADTLKGTAKADKLYGNDGNDVITGGEGKDWIRGGKGSDIFVYNSLKDAGDTIADFTKGDKINIASIVKTFTNHGNVSSLYSLVDLKNHGFVQIKSLADGDTAIYIDADGSKGSGKAVLLATLLDSGDALNSADAFILGEPGTKPPVTPANPLTLIGKDANDTLTGGTGADVLKGNNGNDTLYGGRGDDSLWGNNGNDILIGGEGKDWLKGGDGKDTFKFTDIKDIGDIIEDFRVGEKIDIAALVDNFSNGGKDMSFNQLKANQFITIKNIGENVNEIYVDTDGAKGASKAALLATVFGDDDLVASSNAFTV